MCVRTGLDVAALMILWVCSEGLLQVLVEPWIYGITIGGVGFGISAVLLLVGKKCLIRLGQPFLLR